MLMMAIGDMFPYLSNATALVMRYHLWAEFPAVGKVFGTHDARMQRPRELEEGSPKAGHHFSMRRAS